MRKQACSSPFCGEGRNLTVMISSRVSKQVVLEVNSMAKCSNLWKFSMEYGAFSSYTSML